MRLFKAVACLAFYLIVNRYFPIRLLETDAFFGASLSHRYTPEDLPL